MCVTVAAGTDVGIVACQGTVWAMVFIPSPARVLTSSQFQLSFCPTRATACICHGVIDPLELEVSKAFIICELEILVLGDSDVDCTIMVDDLIVELIWGRCKVLHDMVPIVLEFLVPVFK